MDLALFSLKDAVLPSYACKALTGHIFICCVGREEKLFDWF